jgi:Oxysterol-binding protein
MDLGMQANEEKQRLEKKQRRARKEAEEGVPIVSRWFEPVPGATRGEVLSYRYKGGYWEQRADGQFTECRDIFGQDE